MRYFLTLSFDGTRYHGWQVQPNAISVQGELARALSTLLRTDVMPTGAGRTDAGVHALRMVAHFDAPPLNLSDFQRRLNRLLPPDIYIINITRARGDAHARFSATSRTYHYFLSQRKDPFTRQTAAQMFYALDFALMNEAASRLLSVSDFTSFSKLHTDTKTNLCRVTRAEWTEVKPQLWRFEITADRFLRNMVRAIVGTLIEVGRGRMSLSDFEGVIAQKNRCAAADSVPACGLFLTDVSYPADLFLPTLES